MHSTVPCYCTAHNNCTAEQTVYLFTTITAHYSWYKITESHCLSVVQHSLSSMSSPQVTCLYDLSGHLMHSVDAEKILSTYLCDAGAASRS